VPVHVVVGRALLPSLPRPSGRFGSLPSTPACALKAEAARYAGIDPDRISFTVTVRIARDHAAAIRPSGQGRNHAILDILADLLPTRRSRQCERVKKPPRNTFPARKRGETPPASNASYAIKITKKTSLPAFTP
jgi:hypothetical protein